MAVNERNIKGIAERIQNNQKNIILIYAFNGTGKTRLSMKYKDITKISKKEAIEKNGENVEIFEDEKDVDEMKTIHTGVYYNAYSEDLFQWNNDAENKGEEIVLKVIPSSLNQYHSHLNVDKVKTYLNKYNFRFDIKFNRLYDDEEKPIISISFFSDNNSKIPIKISRGEERIFIWCFFLALFDIDALSGKQNQHFYIDDPVSSLDENNIFITTSTIIDIIERYSQDRKIIITTHHIGFFSMLANWLEHMKDDNNDKYKYKHKMCKYILKKYSNTTTKKIDGIEHDILKENIQLEDYNNELFLYHLVIIDILDKAIYSNKLYGYHVVLLRQLLEYISSFIGRGNFSEVLKKVGFTDDEVKNDATLINFLSHKNLFTLHTNLLDVGQVNLFKDIFERIKNKYEFDIKKDNQTDNNPIKNIEINSQNEGNI